MCFLSFFPSSKIVNRHKIYIQVKDICIFFQNVLIWWAIIIISCNSLSFIRIQIIQIFRRYLSGSFFIYYRIYDCYGIQYKYVCIKFLDKVFDLFFVAIKLFIRIRPCRQIIPSCSTGSPFLTRNTIVDVYGELSFGNSSIHPSSISPAFSTASTSYSNVRSENDVRLFNFLSYNAINL